MACVCQDVPVKYPDRDAVPVVSEFPVRCLLGLRIADRPKHDEVIVRIAALTSRCLLLPVRQRISLGLVRLVYQQEYAAVGGVSDVNVVSAVRNLPASRDADGETSRIGVPVKPSRHRARSGGRW